MLKYKKFFELEVGDHFFFIGGKYGFYKKTDKTTATRVGIDGSYRDLHDELVMTHPDYT